MLPRVSAALAQFIKPIATSQSHSSAQQETKEKRRDVPDQSQHKDHSRKNFQKYQAPQEEHSNVVPFQKPDDNPRNNSHDNKEASSEPAMHKSESTAGAGPAGSTLSFLRLFTNLQQNKGHLLRWLGFRSYSSNQAQQSRSRKYRKGAMLDHKA